MNTIYAEFVIVKINSYSDMTASDSIEVRLRRRLMPLELSHQKIVAVLPKFQYHSDVAPMTHSTVPRLCPNNGCGLPLYETFDR